VTLRARLTAAFLAVVLGPVLLGAVFVGVTVSAVNRNRSAERVGLAATAVRTSVAALCQRLHAAADSAAALSQSRDLGVVNQIVQRGLASGVRLTDPQGEVRYSSPGVPGQPWADCGVGGNAVGVTAIAARVDVRAASGSFLGYAEAIAPLDPALVHDLASASGAAVTVLGSGGGGGLNASYSTEQTANLSTVVDVADRLSRGGLGRTRDGRYVRRLDPEPGQPLSLAMSVGPDEDQGMYAALAGVVVLGGLVAAAAAWWLARSTIRPLSELAVAVERVADGDLTARVPVRSTDEVGRLGATFNRMTRETQGYVQALTASRDQLRGHLGLLGDTLSSTHDLTRILDVILQSAMSATGAQAGILLLAEAGTGMLVGQCGEGLGGRSRVGGAMETGAVRLRMGEGLLGAVAASGEARRGRVERDGPALSVHEPGCRTYVAVPFAAPGGVHGPTTGVYVGNGPLADEPDGDPAANVGHGVLALYDRHGFDEFDDADAVTLRTFAGQAAVALDNVRVHEEAQRLSLTDPLTGLSNYRFLKESLRREVERAHRFGRTLAVLALDIDRFKEVNDTYGHAAGDSVLAEFARRIRAEIREVDFAFRQGGEEFVVLLPETDEVGSEVVAERLATAMRRTPVLVSSAQGSEPVQIPITVSIGIAVYPDHGGTGAAVLEAADDALYAAKAAGRDGHRVAVPGTGRHRGETTGGDNGWTGADELRASGADGDGSDRDPAPPASAGVGGASNPAQPPRQSRGG
jgi:diguanylate cyclase (GGDEF)-like protein